MGIALAGTSVDWAAAAGLSTLVASVCAGRAAIQSQGRGKLGWGLLAAATGLTGVVQALWILGAWTGAEWLPAPVLQMASRTTLVLFLLLGLYLMGALKPHRAASHAARPAPVVDTLLLGLLFLGLHSYFLVSGLRSSGPSRWTPALGLVLWGGMAASALGSGARQARSPHWQRVYRLLAGAAWCEALSQAVLVWTFDPGLVTAPAGAAVAEWLKGGAGALLAWAALLVQDSTAAEEPPGEVPLVSAWRELAVPVLVLLFLLGVPLLDRAASEVPLFGGPDLRLYWGLLSTALGSYILLILIRQFLAQMENRALGLGLQQESARLQLLVDNIHDAVLIEDLEGRIVFANDRFLELFGIRRADLPRWRLDDGIRAEDRPPGALDRTARLLAASGPTRFEFRGVRPGGAPLYLESSTVPVQTRGLVRGFQSVIRDITDRRQAEERQRELVQRLEFFVNHMPLGCILWDLDYNIVEWNGSAARIFGWQAPEVFGRHGPELLAPPHQWPAMLAKWQELRESKTSNHGVFLNLTKERGPIECEWFNTSLIDQAGRVVAVATMVQDVTEKRNLEAQLRQSQKMEAVGVLAGGIAHDFNNLLTIIGGNLSLTQMQLGPAHAVSRGLADAEKAADRAAELVRQLLSFGRKSHTQPRPILVNDCVGDLSLLRGAIGPRIEIETRLQPDLWRVQADPGQIDQVLLNLCVNARDAMPEGGRLTISTDNRDFSEEYCRTRPAARPGQFVELAVSDTGIGLDEATRARIFEPFFTTKAVGKGSGLGLAMVYGIVEQHGGWIAVDSAPGRGAVFSIFLPRSNPSGAGPAPTPAPAAAAGAQTILLVDDEEMILRLARAILEGGGHRVLEARDGEEALAVFEQHRDEVDLVLLDMIMPRKSGRDTLAELHRRAPEVPVVLASGYTPVGEEELAGLGARAYVRKPYQPLELARTVRQILDSAASSGPASPSHLT